MICLQPMFSTYHTPSEQQKTNVAAISGFLHDGEGASVGVPVEHVKMKKHMSGRQLSTTKLTDAGNEKARNHISPASQGTHAFTETHEPTDPTDRIHAIVTYVSLFHQAATSCGGLSARLYKNRSRCTSHSCCPEYPLCCHVPLHL